MIKFLKFNSSSLLLKILFFFFQLLKIIIDQWLDTTAERVLRPCSSLMLGGKIIRSAHFCGRKIEPCSLVWSSFEKKEKEEENVNLTWTWFERYFDVASVKLESRWHFIRTRWLIFYSKWTKLKWCVLAKWNIEIALSTLYYFRSTNEISFRTYSYFRFPRINLFFFFSFFFFPQPYKFVEKEGNFLKEKNINSIKRKKI